MTDIILVKTSELKMGEAVATIERYQKEMPGHEVFLDGDARAIVARARA